MKGGNFFPFKGDPFLGGVGVQKRKQEITKVISLVKNCKKTTKCIVSPLDMQACMHFHWLHIQCKCCRWSK